MIHGLKVMNPKGEILDLVLSDPWSSGINVKNITGISPPQSDIFIAPYGSIDGSVYVGSRVPQRNIVLTLALMFNPQVEDSRYIVYNFFRIKDEATMLFFTDARSLMITGYVESNEVDIFSKDETATISVICNDPWFHSEQKNAVRFSGVMPRFEFPFWSEADQSEMIEFGDITIDTRTVINYKGDIQTGFVAYITFSSTNFHNVYFYNMQTRERMTLFTDSIERITGYPLAADDEIQLSTLSGQKTAYLLRNGVLYNVISMVGKDSTWFQLTKGDNILAIASDYGVENIGFRLVYQDSYAGI